MRLSLPAGLAQAFEHVGVVLRPHPGHAVAHMQVERQRRHSLSQRRLRFPGATKLAERGSKPTVCCRIIGKSPDRARRCFDRSLILVREIMSLRDL